MAQGRLTLVAVLALGVAAEAAAAPSPRGLAVADFAVGAGIGCAGACLLARARRPALLALATSTIWFAGTLDGASVAWLASLGSLCLLAYRGPLLHLLLALPSGRLGDQRARALAAAGWIGGLLPLTSARLATAGAAAFVAGVAAMRARRAAADRRRAFAAAGVCAAALGAVWLVPVAFASGGTALTLANDLAVLAAAAVALSAASGMWTRSAAGALVVALGRARHPGRPVTAQLARALADPELELCYAVPGLGWVDEHGRSIDAPDDDGRAVTRAVAPGGGEVALVHGPTGSPDPRLAAAAAAAAALALDAARLEAELRARATDVRASRRRLLTTADAERRALAQRLNDGVLARLRRVNRLIDLDASTQPLRGELDAAVVELTALGRGLYPPAVLRADLAEALGDLAARSIVPTTVDVSGDSDRLPDGHRAAMWFICSEALANVAQHADAAHATVTMHANHESVALEVGDDGRGGASLTRGLHGIADRVEALGGTFTVSSPPGGPTLLRAEFPLSAGDGDTRSKEGRARAGAAKRSS